MFVTIDINSLMNLAKVLYDTTEINNMLNLITKDISNFQWNSFYMVNNV